VLSEAYGGEAMKKSSVFERHKRFRAGREKIDHDDERNDENVEKMRNLVHLDRSYSIIAVAVLLNLDTRTVTCVEKRPELRPNDWILHHDSASAHKALSVKVSGPKID
jgi:hypothetical protein